MKFEFKDMLQIGVVLAAFAAGYGTLTWRVAAIEKVMEERSQQALQLVVLEQRMKNIEERLVEIREVLKKPVNER